MTRLLFPFTFNGGSASSCRCHLGPAVRFCMVADPVLPVSLRSGFCRDGGAARARAPSCSGTCCAIVGSPRGIGVPKIPHQIAAAHRPAADPWPSRDTDKVVISPRCPVRLRSLDRVGLRRLGANLANVARRQRNLRRRSFW